MSKRLSLFLAICLFLGDSACALAPPSTSRGHAPGTRKTQQVMQQTAAFRYRTLRGPDPFIREIEWARKQAEWWGEDGHARSTAVKAFLRERPFLLSHGVIKGHPWGTGPAELWLGAHPESPAPLKVNGHVTDLRHLIEGAPSDVLGEAAVDLFGPRLPFLMKVLSSSSASPIRTHPEQDRAQDSWPAGRKERRAAFTNVYQSPGMICAVTPFWVFTGFRPADEIARDLEALNLSALRREVALFRTALDAASPDDKTSEGEALKEFYTGLMSRVAALQKASDEGDVRALALARGEIEELVTSLVASVRDRLASSLGTRPAAPFSEFFRAAREQGKVPALKRELWTLRLSEQYPDTLEALSPFLLNLVRLDAGRALHLPPGHLYAYHGRLDPEADDEGVAIELTAAPDNVPSVSPTSELTFGPELLTALSFDTDSPRILSPQKTGRRGKSTYETPAEEFELSVIELSSGTRFRSDISRSADILIAFEGSVLLTVSGGRSTIVKEGHSFVLPANAGWYSIEPLAPAGRATLYQASVPSHLLTDRKVLLREQENNALSVDDRTRLWTASARAVSEKLEVILPQSITLTQKMSSKLASSRVEYGWDLDVTRIPADGLAQTLVRPPLEKKRIIVADKALAKEINKLAECPRGIELLRDVRVLRMDVPSGPDIAEALRTTYQARMFMIALITRSMDGRPAQDRILKALLSDLLRGTLSDPRLDIAGFVEQLTSYEDAGTQTDAIKERVLFCIAEMHTVRLVQELRKSFDMLKEFWIYA